MTKLILTRHGQSTWNAENRFTGWVDVDLSDKGIEEAEKSGQIINDGSIKEIDVSGKTIVPGFVDTHAHVRVSRNVHRAETWSFAANLAYGVTTVRDPQTGTTDILSYADMVEWEEIFCQVFHKLIYQ